MFIREYYGLIEIYFQSLFCLKNVFFKGRVFDKC